MFFSSALTSNIQNRHAVKWRMFAILLIALGCMAFVWSHWCHIKGEKEETDSLTFRASSSSPSSFLPSSPSFTKKSPSKKDGRWKGVSKDTPSLETHPETKKCDDTAVHSVEEGQDRIYQPEKEKENESEL